MGSEELRCWKCGESLAALPVPLARLAECPSCRADVHVCRQCRFYDTRVAKSCREPIAEEVKDKEHANFCEFFQARADAHAAADTTESEAAKMKLDALFGLGSAAAPAPASDDPARRALEDLFGIDSKPKP